MSIPILIIGNPGSGKSASLRTLNPKTTFLINIIGKSLPFKSYRKDYKPISCWDDKEGNCYVSDNYQQIIKCIQVVDKLRPDIKTLVLDDWQYMLSHEFMRRVSETKFQKFNEMASHAWESVMALKPTRNDLTTFVLAHCDTDEKGQSKLKTIGKLLDTNMRFDGEFELTLHTRIIDGDYLFQTKSSEDYFARVPMGMFDDEFIPNDLMLVKQSFEAYFNDEE